MADAEDLFSDLKPNNKVNETNQVNDRNLQQSFHNNNANADSNEYEDDNDSAHNEDKLSKNKPQTLSPSTQSSIISATVKNAVVKDNIVFYEIQVKSDNGSWNITKRYSQFEELHNSLIDNRRLVLPAKHNKMFTDHLSPAFIEQRRALLDNYVKKLLKKNTSQPLILKFLNEDKNPDTQNDTANNNSNSNNNNNNTEKEGLEFPEDQEVTGISIPTIRKMIDHVLYQIEVTNERQRKSFSTWTVLKRFGNFYDMDIKLRQGLNTKTDVIEKLPPAPPRRAKLVYDHMDDNFIEERRVLLEHYLNKLIQFPEVTKNENFLEFLGVNTI